MTGFDAIAGEEDTISMIPHKKTTIYSFRSLLSAAFATTIAVVLAVTLSIVLSPSSHHADAASNPTTGITVHILDTSVGLPASAVGVQLEYLDGPNWNQLTTSVTNSNGRCDPFWPTDDNEVLYQSHFPLISLSHSSQLLSVGLYRMTFLTQDYFTAQNKSSFYPLVNIVFNVTNPSGHYHIPLILSPYGYTTYRGS
jgi:5-hydroxyisourate hydrolase